MLDLDLNLPRGGAKSEHSDAETEMLTCVYGASVARSLLCQGYGASVARGVCVYHSLYGASFSSLSRGLSLFTGGGGWRIPLSDFKGISYPSPSNWSEISYPSPQENQVFHTPSLIRKNTLNHLMGKKPPSWHGNRPQ